MSDIPPADVTPSLDAAVAHDSNPLSNGHSPKHHTNGNKVTSLNCEEQALESHEVIELQTFSERKAWIEQKIKFLEKMPPIEVFVGLDAVRSSAEEVPGLPSRQELAQWLEEHDAIEKETEIFDRGELTKLRQLTKAATQRNLSPADTDVIELTLTTIYALDKLLHLLRDRSDNLELLSDRLDWEECRIAAWIERRKILEDITTFLEARARWNPSCYDEIVQPDEHHDLVRKASSASLASNNSESSSALSPAFSRSARFRTAELLSRDAAQLGARVTGLRHGKIAAAGKALDKLIDRRTVPDILIDEQEKLEDKGITELEHIGKFIMGAVMQWRKADEIYIETMKDKTSTQNLYEEIEAAKLQHPTARHYTAFTSRADTLLKRLFLRGNPASLFSTFPRPEHLLFPTQPEFNKTLTELLSSEILSTMQVARKAAASAKAYGIGFEAVKTVEDLIASAGSLSGTFTQILAQLRDGISSDNGDGSPLDLSSELCLEASRHLSFLALLPSVIRHCAQTVQNSEAILNDSAAAISNLSHPGIDKTFKAQVISELDQLRSLRREAEEACANMKAQSDQLREARCIWGTLDKTMQRLEVVGQRVTGAVEHARWRQASTPNHTETSNRDASSAEVPKQILEELGQIEGQVISEGKKRLDALSRVLEPSLSRCFAEVVVELDNSLVAATRGARLLEAIQRQSAIMRFVFEEFNQLQVQIDDIIKKVKFHTDHVLTDAVLGVEITEKEAQASLSEISQRVSNFINGLSQRVLLIGDHPIPINASSTLLRKSPLTSDKFRASFEVPVELASLDDTVRSDTNSFVMQLNGKMESLVQAIFNLQAACVGKEVEDALQGAVSSIDTASQKLSRWKGKLSEILSQEGDLLAGLQALLEIVESSVRENESQISALFLPLRDSLRRLEVISGAHEIYVARRTAVDYAESRYQTWETDVLALKDDICHQQKVERDRLARLFLEEEQRQQAERARIAAEEVVRLRLEKERVAFELEKRCVEEERKAEVRRQVEKARAAAEEAERARLEKERIDAAEKQRLEEERIAEEKRTKLEKERIATEEAEKARLRDERFAAEEKLRLVQEELAQERRTMAEKDRLAAETLEQQRHLQALAEENAGGHSRSRSMGNIQQGPEELLSAGQHYFPQQLNELLVKSGSRQLVDIFSNATSLLEGHASGREHSPPSSPSDKQAPRTPSPVQQVMTPRSEHFRKNLNLPPLDIDGKHIDVFTLRIVSPERSKKTKEMLDLQTQIVILRKRLRSISINEISRPTRSTTSLPDLEQFEKMAMEFAGVRSGVFLLPASVEDPVVDLELRSLRSELEASADLLKRVNKLAVFADEIHLCDAALSDLLEHIDSYPESPKGNLSSSYTVSETTTPEEQLSGRLSFTRGRIQSMSSKLADVANDSRVIAEKDRVLQTWSELEEMTNDQLKETPSGKGSPTDTSMVSNSSHSNFGPASNNASLGTRRHIRKDGSYSNLSMSTANHQKRLLAPPQQPSPRRVLSGGAAEPQSKSRYESRPPSQLSNFSSNRSVSGPLGHSIYGSTFASRQRTASLSTSTNVTPTRRTPIAIPRHRNQTSQDKRPSSPATSETSSYVRAHSRSSTSMSTWGRAPRNSLSSFVPNISAIDSTPQKKPPIPRKRYIADPKNKLDMAVGDVVNKLPIAINVEGVSETWRDQSGKYWIGNQDPKLCFCRILRSRTVMVRVGGGWTELSKFIKEHFAESFRLLPESPPHVGTKEERWISSAMLLERDNGENFSISIPQTPEPSIPFAASFAMRTPTRSSPHSVKSSSPSLKGSPLTPMQFIRRADVDSMMRPVTPSKPTTRTRNTAAHTQGINRTSIWRP